MPPALEPLEPPRAPPVQLDYYHWLSPCCDPFHAARNVERARGRLQAKLRAELRVAWDLAGCTPAPAGGAGPAGRGRVQQHPPAAGPPGSAGWLTGVFADGHQRARWHGAEQARVPAAPVAGLLRSRVPP
jgi:hypothetical protein